MKSMISAMVLLIGSAVFAAEPRPRRLVVDRDRVYIEPERQMRAPSPLPRGLIVRSLFGSTAEDGREETRPRSR